MAGDPHTAAIFRWLDAVAADATLPPAAFKLAYAISQHINRQSKEAWPSQETLKDSLGLKDERSVRRLTDALETHGFLITRRRKQMSMIYRLAQDRTELSYQEEQTQTGTDARADIPVRSTDQDRTFESARPDNPVPQDRTELSAKPLKEPLIEPGERGRARAKMLPNDFGLDMETQLWAESRLGGQEAVEASMFNFVNHHRSKGSQYVDWTARARLWIEEDAKRLPAKSLTATAQSLISRGVAFGPRPLSLSERLSLGPFGEELGKRIDHDGLRSWFVGKVSLELDGRGGVTLTAPNPFIRDAIKEKFEAQVLAAVQAVNPAATGLTFAVKRNAA